MKCNLCASTDIVPQGPVGLKPVSVTSDSKLCGVQATIYWCRACGHLQKIHTPAELLLVKSIYDHYDAHHLSGGSEQLVFPVDGPPRARTYYAIEQCVSLLPDVGRLLDVGTGNGAVLKSASRLLPRWTFYGFDVDDKCREQVLAIPNVAGFASGSLDDVSPEKFDLAVLWHTLEHVPEPAATLAELRERLTERGSLLIQVPDAHRTPFDLAVIDHCSHFTRAALLRLCDAAGFSVAADGYDWTHNCLTLLLSRRAGAQARTSPASDGPASDRYCQWLNGTVEHFDEATRGGDWAMFGTGMAGIWVASQLSNPPRVFVDEDRAKAGHHVNGISIVTPDTVPEGLKIVMPFTHGTGATISLKLRGLYPACGSCSFVTSRPLP